MNIIQVSKNVVNLTIKMKPNKIETNRLTKLFNSINEIKEDIKRFIECLTKGRSKVLANVYTDFASLHTKIINIENTFDKLKKAHPLLEQEIELVKKDFNDLDKEIQKLQKAIGTERNILIDKKGESSLSGKQTRLIVKQAKLVKRLLERDSFVKDPTEAILKKYAENFATKCAGTGLDATKGLWNLKIKDSKPTLQTAEKFEFDLAISKLVHQFTTRGENFFNEEQNRWVPQSIRRDINSDFSKLIEQAGADFEKKCKENVPIDRSGIDLLGKEDFLKETQKIVYRKISEAKDEFRTQIEELNLSDPTKKNLTRLCEEKLKKADKLNDLKNYENKNSQKKLMELVESIDNKKFTSNILQSYVTDSILSLNEKIKKEEKDILDLISDEETKTIIKNNIKKDEKICEIGIIGVNSLKDFKDIIGKIEVVRDQIENKDYLVNIQSEKIGKQIKENRKEKITTDFNDKIKLLENRINKFFEDLPYVSVSIRQRVKNHFEAIKKAMIEELLLTPHSDPQANLVKLQNNFSARSLASLVMVELTNVISDTQSNFEKYIEITDLPAEIKKSILEEVKKNREAYDKANKGEEPKGIQKGVEQFQGYEVPEKKVLSVLSESNKVKQQALQKAIDRLGGEIYEKTNTGDAIIQKEINSIQKWLLEEKKEDGSMESHLFTFNKLADFETKLNSSQETANKLRKAEQDLGKLKAIIQRHKIEDGKFLQQIIQLNQRITVAKADEVDSICDEIKSLNIGDGVKGDIKEKYLVRYQESRKRAEQIWNDQILIVKRCGLSDTKSSLIDNNSLETSWAEFRKSIEENDLDVDFEKMYSNNIDGSISKSVEKFKEASKEEIKKIVDEKFSRFVVELTEKFLNNESTTNYNSKQIEVIKKYLKAVEEKPKAESFDVLKEFDENMILKKGSKLKLNNECSEKFKKKVVERLSNAIKSAAS